jgi:hypothetical protein
VLDGHAEVVFALFFHGDVVQEPEGAEKVIAASDSLVHDADVVDPVTASSAAHPAYVDAIFDFLFYLGVVIRYVAAARSGDVIFVYEAHCFSGCDELAYFLVIGVVPLCLELTLHGSLEN